MHESSDYLFFVGNVYDFRAKKVKRPVVVFAVSFRVSDVSFEHIRSNRIDSRGAERITRERKNKKFSRNTKNATYYYYLHFPGYGGGRGNNRAVLRRRDIYSCVTIRGKYA